MAEICPLCCAGQRDETCGDCAHRVTAQRYAAERHASATLPDGHFIAEINPAVERAVNEAAQLAQRGKNDQAQAAMERLLREHPANHTVHFGMGILHAIRGEHLESIPWFDRATAIYPYFAEAHFNKAVACQKELDVAGAIRAYRKVVEVGDPQDPEVARAKRFLADVAATIFKQGKTDLDTFLESQDTFNRAFALMEQGGWDQALAGFRAAAAMNDRNAPTHGNMGLCLAKLGRRADALSELDRALEIDPQYEPARQNRAVVERMQESVPMDIAQFKRIAFNKEKIMSEQKGRSWLRRLITMKTRARWFAYVLMGSVLVLSVSRVFMKQGESDHANVSGSVTLTPSGSGLTSAGGLGTGLPSASVSIKAIRTRYAHGNGSARSG
jgi:tetratricopeptide (TPR) repeat protein